MLSVMMVLENQTPYFMGVILISKSLFSSQRSTFIGHATVAQVKLIVSVFCKEVYATSAKKCM